MTLILATATLVVTFMLQYTFTDAAQCYQCDHVAHPRDCDRTVQCKDGEICNAVAYAQSDGHFYYKVGCLARSSCPGSVQGGKRDIAFCNRCCEGNYCNKELCDGPPATEHGPRCLQCTTVEDPSHCGAVTECAKGQVCYTQEKYVFGERRYQLGCADPGCAPVSKRRSLFERQAATCVKCCTGENCNRDLCWNTGSPFTQAPMTSATQIPNIRTTARPAHTNPPANAKTTTAYNIHGCFYKGKVYHLNDTWDEGCEFSCTCVDESIGRYSCHDICPTYVQVPDSCKLVTPAGECCAHPVCSGNHYVNITHTQDSCYFRGKEYKQDETWRDGCDYDCTCIDATKGFYRCTSLCYSWNLPTECHLNPPAIGKCCETPSCPGDSCYFRGKEYKQDATWRDGCDYDCTCIDATKGVYRCTSLCYSWNLPTECHLNPPATGKCCETPSCPGGYVIKYPQGYVVN